MTRRRTFTQNPQTFINAVLVKEGSDYYVTFGDNKIKLPESKNEGDCLVPYEGKEVIFGIRPEHIRDDEEFISKNPDSVIEADVEVTELMGAETYL